MTRQRTIERVLDQWFTERPTGVADRVLDEVADRIGRQPQQPAWLVLWRDSHVNAYLKYASVAAVVLVAAVGIAVMRPPSGSNPGGAASPTPSPTPGASTSRSTSPSTSPSPSAEFPEWFPERGEGAGILAAGSHTTREFLGGSTFTVPDGWVNDGDYAPAFYLFPDTPANEAEYVMAQQKALEIILTDRVQNNMFAICDATGLFRGATASEVIDALLGNEALSTTDPVDVTIDGLSGRQVDVQLNPAWAGSCPPSENDPPTRDYTDARDRLIVLDTPVRGTIGIRVSSLYSADFEAFLAEAMPIVESFQFDFTP